MSTEDEPGTRTPHVGDQPPAGYQGPHYVTSDSGSGQQESGQSPQGSWSGPSDQGAWSANHSEQGAWSSDQQDQGAWASGQAEQGAWAPNQAEQGAWAPNRAEQGAWASGQAEQGAWASGQAEQGAWAPNQAEQAGWGAGQHAGAGSSAWSSHASPAAPAFPAPAGVALLQPQPAKARTGPRGRLGALLVAASLAAVVGAGAGVGSYAYLDQGTSAAPITVTTEPAKQAPALDGTVAAAAATIQPSVVTISVQSGQGGGVGSGVVLDTDGHILTNDHVVSGAAGSQSGGQAGGQDQITVTFFDGTTASARVVGTSSTNDLAVIKVEGVDDLKPATFASSSAVTVGQAVVAAGAPLGLSQSVTSGIVSNTARPVRSGDNDDAVYLAVQTDAAINPGNSGGPLVDLNGAVLGINSSIASTGSGSGSSQSGNIGIGFAIPADVAVRVAGELIADGTSTNAALGVTVGGSDSAVSAATGVSLQSVAAGGAAEQAGLEQGDVVTRLNDFPTTTPDGLIAATRFYAPGTEVTLTYIRDGGSPQTVEVTLGQQ